jgi:hypothetical protein
VPGKCSPDPLPDPLPEGCLGCQNEHFPGYLETYPKSPNLGWGIPPRMGYTPSPNRGLASLLYPNGYCVDAALDRVPSRSNLGPDPLGPPSDPSGRTLVDFDDFQDPEDLEFLRFSGSWKEAIQRMCRSGLGGGWRIDPACAPAGPLEHAVP